MSEHQTARLMRYRRKRAREGFVRVEVQVMKEDASLIRSIAQSLADPSHASESRSFLKAHFANEPRKDFKAFLAEAPLEDEDIERSHETGRSVDL